MRVPMSTVLIYTKSPLVGWYVLVYYLSVIIYPSIMFSFFSFFHRIQYSHDILVNKSNHSKWIHTIPTTLRPSHLEPSVCLLPRLHLLHRVAELDEEWRWE